MREMLLEIAGALLADGREQASMRLMDEVDKHFPARPPIWPMDEEAVYVEGLDGDTPTYHAFKTDINRHLIKECNGVVSFTQTTAMMRAKHARRFAQGCTVCIESFNTESD